MCDARHLSLDKPAAPEPLGEANTFLADFVNSREGNVDFSDVDGGGVCGAPASPARVLASSSSPAARC
jgi:hypothetical protein